MKPSNNEHLAVTACRQIELGPDSEWNRILTAPAGTENLRRRFAVVCANLGVCGTPEMAMNYAFKAGVERALDWAHSVAAEGLLIPDEDPSKFKCPLCGQPAKENWCMCSACASDF